ncbi:MAG: HTTM domain-containing protein [Polyangiaceae bacterium]
MSEEPDAPRNDAAETDAPPAEAAIEVPSAPGPEAAVEAPSAPTAESPLAAPAAPRPRVPSRVEIVERAVVTFFGAPSTGESAALFRIAFGLLALWTSIGVWLNLERYYGPDGLVPWDMVKGDPYVEKISLFALAPDSQAMLAGHAVAFTLASVLFTVGLFPRVSAIVISYVNVSLQYRNPFILNSGDRLFQIVAAVAAFMPLARRWSVTSYVRRLRGKGDGPLGTDFGARLIQLEIAYVYLSSFIAKISNTRWRTGIALRDVLSSPVFAEWPAYLSTFPIVGFLTYMTLVFELGFPLLIWFKKPRPWLILWGIAFHAGIDALMIIPMFSMVMIVCYLPYLTDGEALFTVRAIRSPRQAVRAWLRDRAATKAGRSAPSPTDAPTPQSRSPNV